MCLDIYILCAMKQHCSSPLCGKEALYIGISDVFCQWLVLPCELVSPTAVVHSLPLPLDCSD